MFVQDNKLSTLKIYFTNKLLKTGLPIEEAKSYFQIITSDFLGISKVDILVNPDLRLSEGDLLRYNSALKKLIRNIPVQYVLGKTEFYGRVFTVNESVLIPRPETEELVDWVVSAEKSDSSIDVIDIGTGSGCIAISLDLGLDNAQVSALDISASALKVAMSNNASLNAKVNFEQADIIDQIPVAESFDIIVSNPPYVRDLERIEMHDRVKNNEPKIALFVDDDDPLVFYRAIANYALLSLKKGGRMYLEINQYLAEETKELLMSMGFVDVELRKDLYDNYRMIRAVFH